MAEVQGCGNYLYVFTFTNNSGIVLYADHQLSDAAPSHQSAVKPILTTLSIANMQANLATLTAYNNRYYSSSTGAAASAWILSKVQSV